MTHPIEDDFESAELDALQAQWPKFNPEVECYSCCGKLSPGEYYFCRSCAEAKFGNEN